MHGLVLQDQLWLTMGHTFVTSGSLMFRANTGWNTNFNSISSSNKRQSWGVNSRNQKYSSKNGVVTELAGLERFMMNFGHIEPLKNTHRNMSPYQLCFCKIMPCACWVRIQSLMGLESFKPWLYKGFKRETYTVEGVRWILLQIIWNSDFSKEKK